MSKILLKSYVRRIACYMYSAGSTWFVREIPLPWYHLMAKTTEIPQDLCLKFHIICFCEIILAWYHPIVKITEIPQDLCLKFHMIFSWNSSWNSLRLISPYIVKCFSNDISVRSWKIELKSYLRDLHVVLDIVVCIKWTTHAKFGCQISGAWVADSPLPSPSSGTERLLLPAREGYAVDQHTNKYKKQPAYRTTR